MFSRKTRNWKLKQLRMFDHYFCENVLNASKEIVVLGCTCTPLMCNAGLSAITRITTRTGIEERWREDNFK